MKTPKILKLIFILFLLAILPMTAGNNESSLTDFCRLPDYPPVLAGSMDNTMYMHFKYPAEAWRAHKMSAMMAILHIDSLGHVQDVESESPVHPALLAEVKRVMQKTTWYPVTYKDKPVNVKYRQFLGFMDSEVARFPRGLDKYAAKAEKIVKSWRKVEGVDEIDNDQERRVRMAVEMVPEYLPITFNLIAYLNASGQHNQARVIAD